MRSSSLISIRAAICTDCAVWKRICFPVLPYGLVLFCMVLNCTELWNLYSISFVMNLTNESDVIQWKLAALCSYTCPLSWISYICPFTCRKVSHALNIWTIPWQYVSTTILCIRYTLAEIWKHDFTILAVSNNCVTITTKYHLLLAQCDKKTMCRFNP